MAPERKLTGIERDLYEKALNRFVAEHLKAQPVYHAMKWTPHMGGEAVSSTNYTDYATSPDGRTHYRIDSPAKSWLEAHTHRRFKLVRLEDVHGVSGTGVVAEGVQFSDGKAVIRWIVGEHRTTVPHEGIDSVEGIHSHDGRTQIVWVD